MADRDVKIPRRKKGAKFHPRESPFPIPVQTITEKESSSDRWFYYNGYFRDNCVVVEDLGDLTFLYKMGFFGKGFLSRSKPEYEVISNISQKAFSKSEKLRRLPPKEREIRQSKFRVIRKERFKNHQQWSKQAASDFMLDANDRADNGRQSVDVGVETPVVVQEEGNTYHPAKRRKEDNEAVKEDFGTDQLADGCDIAGSSESRLRTEDRDLNMQNDNSGDSEEEGISSRDLDEVVQDVVRKNKVTTAQFREQEDLDSPVEDMKQAKHEKSSKWQEDPYKVYEHLQLSLEEAFFLSYGLGCLCVWGEEKKPLSLGEMWCAFCAAKQDFIPSYIAYHYFRSKGWVPKVGIKYGTDFVLYKEGMPFYHSSYSVIVQMVESQTLGEENKNDSSPCRKLTWPQLCGVSRVNGHAAKEVMICYVIKPSGLTKDEMSSPSCIPRFKLQEVVLRRWIPERAREPDKAET